jgi:hypothetical protein
LDSARLTIEPISEVRKTQNQKGLKMYIRDQLRTSFKSLRLTVALVALGGFASTSVYADITNAVADSYGPTIYCYSSFNDAQNVLTLSMSQWGNGQVGGTIYTDSTLDPTLTLVHNINNATGIAWNAYHVTVFMPNTFTLSAASVAAPAGWSASITAPVAVVGGFQGQIDYSAGTIVAPGGTLNFQYDLTFANGLAFNFTESDAPGLVPEPSTISLALLGGLAAFRLRKSRKAA